MEYYAAGKKEETLKFYSSMDGPGENYAKWIKPVSERKTSHDLTYVWSLMNTLNQRTK